MGVLIVLLVLLCLILLFLLICGIRELDHLSQMLEHIGKGSQIELTSNLRNRHFLTVYRSLNRILSSYRAKELAQLRAQKQLKENIANLAHDIRTPLTSAAGYLQMLEDAAVRRDMEPLLRYQQIIGHRLEELKDMLEELFLYTKLTSEDFHLECKPVAVYPILSGCMLGMYHLFEEQGTEPQISFENEDVYVSGNEAAMGRVFRNLIQNGLLHGTGGLTVEQRRLQVVFRNNTADRQKGRQSAEHIFDRFYKADQARGKGSSGLGLSIVKELMARMGGKAEAWQEEDQMAIILTFCDIQ